MAKLDLGYCGICGTQIWTLEKGNNKPNEHYAEFTLALSDGTLARHAVCDVCVNNLDDSKVSALLGRIKETWKQESGSWASEKQLQEIESISLKTYDRSDQKAGEKLKDVQIKEHKDKLKEEKKKIKK